MKRNSLFLAILFASLVFSVIGYSQVSFADLTFSEEFGSEGSGNDDFDKPTDLAINSNGDTLYVVDSENNRLKIYELTGGSNCSSGNDEIIDDEVCFDENFGTSGNDDGEFDIPTDLAINKDNGDIYVVDSDNNRVQKFESDGDYDNLEFGSSSSGDDEYLGLPTAIAIDRKSDYIYVADSTTDSISAFDDKGNFQFNFGDGGSSDAEFRDPSGMVVNDSDQMLYVADTDNNRIQVFELTDGDNCPSGTDEIINDQVCFVKDFGSSGNDEGEFDKPEGLAYDDDNDLLYVADTDNNRIQVFEIVSGSTCPSGTDKIVNGVCFVEEFGSSGSGDGQFSSPAGISLDLENGKLYVADTDNHRIQILSVPSGTSSSSGGSSGSSGGSSSDEPNTPTGVRAEPASTSSIVVMWDVPDPDDNNPKVTGYEIEVREGSGSYETIVEDTKSTATSFLHTGLEEGENYRYQISAINSEGTSNSATSSTVRPEATQAPSGVNAVAISKNQILLNWIPPTETFKQSITGYTIEREVIEDILYDPVTNVGGSTTEHTISGLETDKEYSYVITAKFGVGNSPRSNAASATPHTDAEPPTTTTTSSGGGSSSSSDDDDSSSGSDSDAVPSAPRSLNAVATSSQIQLSWKEPSSDGNSAITGYKIEVKKNTGSYTTLESSTASKSYIDSNVDINSTYTYRVSAINSVGTGTSATDSATPKNAVLDISPLGKFSIDENKTLSFTVKITDTSITNVAFSLEQNPPTGAKISANSGQFTWTPTETQGGKTYTFDVKASNGAMTDNQSITITVNDVKTEPVKEPEPPTEPDTPEPPKGLEVASFVDETKDPQYYVDRYNNEPSYKEWFDENYPEYSSIYQAVGLEEPVEAPVFVDPNQDPQYYVDRYNNEPSYKEWFDENYPEYSSIYQAVGLEEPEVEDPEPQIGQCGPGTELVDGKCELVDESNNNGGGGCLIATAAYGSEMSPQVQYLREVRDGKVMNTESGASFMTGFNSLYYSFSPYIADYQRENPMFKEIVKIGITPMLSTLSIMSLADTESEILGYGIGVILMNLGMYVAAPAIVLGYGINKARRKVRF